MHIQIDRSTRYVSLFWPIALIGVGAILLLGNSGRLTHDPVALFMQYWPAIFILVGVDILLSRLGWLGTLGSAAMAVIVVGGVLAYLTAPGTTVETQDWTRLFRAQALRTQSIAEPLAGVRSATVELRLPAGEGKVGATSDSPNLIEGQARTYGDVLNRVTRDGDSARVTFGANEIPFGWFLQNTGRINWDLRLNSAVAYDLIVATGSGKHAFDLSEFDLRSLRFDQASGESSLSLPEGGTYRVDLEVDSGDVRVTVPRGAQLQVNYRVDSGTLDIGETRRVAGARDAGTYQMPGFEDARSKIVFDVLLRSGDVVIR